MIERLINSPKPVLLVGGGDVLPADISLVLETVGAVVAADSGADVLMGMGVVPDAVIGDMDSISPEVRAALPAGCVHHITEQDTTDFDKCLRNINAPLILALGFLGARIDHQLAVLTVLSRRPDQRIMLMGQSDIVAICPPNLELDLPPATRVSLFPMGGVTGRSEGLRWPIDGIDFAPNGTVGTSNEATGPVIIQMDGPDMVIILPAEHAEVLKSALLDAPDTWPVRAR